MRRGVDYERRQRYSSHNSERRLWRVEVHELPTKLWRTERRSAEPGNSPLCTLRYEVTRRNTRVHFIHPLKERIVREVGYGLSLEGASAADLVKAMQANTERAPSKRQVA